MQDTSQAVESLYIYVPDMPIEVDDKLLDFVRDSIAVVHILLLSECHGDSSPLELCRPLLRQMSDELPLLPERDQINTLYCLNALSTGVAMPLEDSFPDDLYCDTTRTHLLFRAI